jgi:hypothetical protein
MSLKIISKYTFNEAFNNTVFIVILSLSAPLRKSLWNVVDVVVAVFLGWYGSRRRYNLGKRLNYNSILK